MNGSPFCNRYIIDLTVKHPRGGPSDGIVFSSVSSCLSDVALTSTRALGGRSFVRLQLPTVNFIVLSSVAFRATFARGGGGWAGGANVREMSV